MPKSKYRKVDTTKNKLKSVTVSVSVGGKPYEQASFQVEEWAIPYVTFAAFAQVEEPDYETAAETELTRS